MVPPHPWRHFGRHWPDVVVRHDLRAGDPRAWTDWSTSPPTVRMRPDLLQVERRCAICHETRHLERGPIVRGLRAREERIVCDLTARWLLPDLDQVRAVLGTRDLHQAAADLWVTFGVLVDRLNGLTDLESRHVHQLREDTA